MESIVPVSFCVLLLYRCESKIALLFSGDILFTGDSRGKVTLYDTRTGVMLKVLCPRLSNASILDEFLNFRWCQLIRPTSYLWQPMVMTSMQREWITGMDLFGDSLVGDYNRKRGFRIQVIGADAHDVGIMSATNAN